MFPILNQKTSSGKDIVYLDNSATTQKPQRVIDAIAHYYRDTNANVHRGIYELSQKATDIYDKSRETIAQFINAKPEEVIFTRNTTESLNLLMRSLKPILKGKEIVVTEMEHHSNLVPWQQLIKELDMKLKFIKLKDDLSLDYEDAESVINENTALVSVVHISNALGAVNDIKRIIEIAKKNNALTIIDGAQSVARMKTDVKELDCDFFAFSGHKMYGPMGIGALYGKKEHLDKMDPFLYGGDMILTVCYQSATWNELPNKFEAGTPNVAGAVGMAEAARFLQESNIDKINEHERELTKYAIEKLKTLSGIRIFEAPDQLGAVSFMFEDVHPHDVADILSEQGVCVRAGHHCAMPLMDKLGVPGTSRASFAIYNTKEDIDALVSALQHVRKVFNG